MVSLVANFACVGAGGSFTAHSPWRQCLTVSCVRDPSLVSSFYVAGNEGVWGRFFLPFSNQVLTSGSSKMTVTMHGLWRQCLTVPGSGTLTFVLSFVRRREQRFLGWCFEPSESSHLMFSSLSIFCLRPFLASGLDVCSRYLTSLITGGWLSMARGQ